VILVEVSSKLGGATPVGKYDATLTDALVERPALRDPQPMRRRIAEYVFV
jgi:hypothetical protein